MTPALAISSARRLLRLARGPWVGVVLLPALAGPALAQAPRITAAGDPSIRADTIYALALDSTAHADAPAIYLLDDGVIRLESDGTSRSSYRQVVQILTPQAAKAWAERSFTYFPESQRFTLNWLRVIRPTGEVLTEKPSVYQESDVPAPLQDPVYVKQRVVRVSIGGIAPGTLVDWSTTVEEFKRPLAGDFVSTWFPRNSGLTRRSRLLLDVPEGFRPTLIETNLPAPRRESTGGTRHLYAWVANDVPAPPRPEPFAADSNDFDARVWIAAPMTWDRIARWYAELARGGDRTTPALDAKLHQLVRGAASLEDSIRAVHRWVAQDVRYVAVALGRGGYQPRPAQQVLETGFGDCKDKATAFIALLRRMGVMAHPVLLYSGGRRYGAPPPSIDAFNHVIVAVVRPSGYQYVDPTSELTPFGELPYPDQGQWALVVHHDGRGETTTLPLADPSANALAITMRGEVSDSGRLHARLEVTATGAAQYGLRQQYATPKDSATRAAETRQLAMFALPDARTDSLEAFDGRDLGATPHVAFVLSGGRLATVSGRTAVLPVRSPGSVMTAALHDLEGRGARRYPIDIAKVNPALVTSSEFRLVLPAGWSARLPPDVRVESPFGRYEAEYAQTGRELHIRWRITGARGILPADRYAELLTWFSSVGADDATAIIIDRK